MAFRVTEVGVVITWFRIAVRPPGKMTGVFSVVTVVTATTATPLTMVPTGTSTPPPCCTMPPGSTMAQSASKSRGKEPAME
jgi:hypothetical protein